MPMRHPLKELPLGSFMPSEYRTSLKRPLSPSASTLLSPSKRRILTQEGLLSSTKNDDNLTPQIPFSESHSSSKSVFTHLDFASLSQPTPRPIVPSASSPLQSPSKGASAVSGLAPSPEITTTSTSRASPFPDGCGEMSSLPMLIPREMPAVSDRQSIHWPGFDIYLDTHISIPTSASLVQQRVAIESTYMDDEAKENIKPTRRIPKAPIASTSTKPLKFVRPDLPTKNVEPLNTISVIFPSPSKHCSSPDKKAQRAKNKAQMMHEDYTNKGEDEIVEKQF